MAGWVKLHRSVADHWLWSSEPFSKGHAWVDLLLMAGHTDRKITVKGVVIELKIGQQARSELTLAKTWKWSRGKVRRFLNQLQKDGMIDQKTGHLTSVISICNYSIYQSGDTTGGTSVSTSIGTSVGHHTVHKQECKKGIKEENTGQQRAQPCPYQKIQDIYNKIIPDPHPRVVSMKSKDRQRLAKSMYGSLGSDLAKVESYFQYLSENMTGFHKGENDRGWIADIEFMMKDKTILKARENNL